VREQRGNGEGERGRGEWKAIEEQTLVIKTLCDEEDNVCNGDKINLKRSTKSEKMWRGTKQTVFHVREFK